jgi:hypothetical protein
MARQSQHLGPRGDSIPRGGDSLAVAVPSSRQLGIVVRGHEGTHLILNAGVGREREARDRVLHQPQLIGEDVLEVVAVEHVRNLATWDSGPTI